MPWQEDLDNILDTAFSDWGKNSDWSKEVPSTDEELTVILARLSKLEREVSLLSTAVQSLWDLVVGDNK